MHTIQHSPQAREDLIDVWGYIAIEKKSPDNADRFLRKLESEFLKLAKSPMIGVVKDEFGKGVRGWPFGNCLIFYRPTEEGMELIRILNANRNLGQKDFM